MTLRLARPRIFLDTTMTASCSFSLRVVYLWRMTASDKTPSPNSSAKRPGRRLRITAAIVLLLGIFGADAAYWLGTHAAEPPDDPSMMVNEKAQSRQEEILYGKQSVLIDSWTQDLKQPGTQAVIIVVTSALVAGGCFYFARLLDNVGEQADEKG